MSLAEVTDRRQGARTAMIVTTAQSLLGCLNEYEEKCAPSQLFVAGDLSIMKSGPRVSVVGSREASDEGVRRAAKLARRLVKEGAVVVSGLATGIDTAAHKAAIEANGRTIGVIGTPLEKAYPASNRELQELMKRDHLVISQFAPGTRTFPSHFPDRNRTMALLSDATIIVEAGEKSGTIHQGWEAIRLGRGLFILESLASSRSYGWIEEFQNYGAIVLGEKNFYDFIEGLPARSPEVSDESFAI